MTQAIYADDNIMNLIIALNKIKDLLTVASCGGHGDLGDGYIVFRCPVETSIILMKLVWRHKGLILHLYADYVNQKGLMGKLSGSQAFPMFMLT